MATQLSLFRELGGFLQTLDTDIEALRAAIVTDAPHTGEHPWGAVEGFRELHERVQRASEQGSELHAVSASTRSYAALLAASSAALEAQEHRLAAAAVVTIPISVTPIEMIKEVVTLPHHNVTDLQHAEVEQQPHTPKLTILAAAPSIAASSVRGMSRSPVTPPSLDIVGLSETSRAALAAMRMPPSTAAMVGFDGASSAVASASHHTRHTVSALPQHHQPQVSSPRALVHDLTIDTSATVAPPPHEGTAANAREEPPTSQRLHTLRVQGIEHAEFSTLPSFLSTQLSRESINAFVSLLNSQAQTLQHTAEGVLLTPADIDRLASTTAMVDACKVKGLVLILIKLNRIKAHRRPGDSTSIYVINDMYRASV